MCTQGFLELPFLLTQLNYYDRTIITFHHQSLSCLWFWMQKCNCRWNVRYIPISKREKKTWINSNEKLDCVMSSLVRSRLKRLSNVRKSNAKRVTDCDSVTTNINASTDACARESLNENHKWAVCASSFSLHILRELNAHGERLVAAHARIAHSNAARVVSISLLTRLTFSSVYERVLTLSSLYENTFFSPLFTFVMSNWKLKSNFPRFEIEFQWYFT